MKRRHDHASALGAPGLIVPPFSVVAPYPPAAVVTSWFNAARCSRTVRTAQMPLVSASESVLPAAAGMDFWPQARLTLDDALTLLPDAFWPARCLLPVPGDVGGLPPAAARALAAGQAVMWQNGTTGLVLSPTRLVGGDRMWIVERVDAQGVAAPPDLRDARAQIMSALERCVVLAESTVLPRDAMASAAVATVAGAEVPLPPGSSAATVTLARQSATVLSIVTEAMASLPDTSEAIEVRAALEPLGRAARYGLSVAFSATPED